jgi:hypothetical protein
MEIDALKNHLDSIYEIPYILYASKNQSQIP